MSSSSDRVVELLNSASLATDSGEKLEALKIVQELLVHKEPNLLDNFLDEVMGFQKDRSQEVRKFVVGFIEEACKKDPDALPQVIANLQMLMSDSALAVQKRVIQAMTHLYKVTLVWISRAKVVTDDMEAVWNVVHGIKEIIIHLLEAENDGIRTHTVKFMEMLVITQTHKEIADFNLLLADSGNAESYDCTGLRHVYELAHLAYRHDINLQLLAILLLQTRVKPRQDSPGFDLASHDQVKVRVSDDKPVHNRESKRLCISAC